MGRNSTGIEALTQARIDLISANTVEQLRTAQAVVMPLEMGLTLEQTGQAIGKSSRWVAKARIKYIKGLNQKYEPKPRGGRRNSLLPESEEADVVAAVRAKSNHWRPLASELKDYLELKHGRRIAASTAYKIIARVDRARTVDLKALNIL